LTESHETHSLTQKIIAITKENKPQTVDQLVTLLEHDLNLEKDEAMDVILELQRRGKVKLEPRSLAASVNLSSYAKTDQALWYWITMIIAVSAAVAVFVIPDGLQPWNYLRSILGIIFVIWLPGYTLTKVLFPVQLPIKTSTENLETVERVIISIGTSLALVPMVGLLLNYTQWGISSTPIVFSLLILTTIVATAALVREHKAKTVQETQA
jgi:uncharacterized membrane protein